MSKTEAEVAIENVRQHTVAKGELLALAEEPDVKVQTLADDSQCLIEDRRCFPHVSAAIEQTRKLDSGQEPATLTAKMRVENSDRSSIQSLRLGWVLARHQPPHDGKRISGQSRLLDLISHLGGCR